MKKRTAIMFFLPLIVCFPMNIYGQEYGSILSEKILDSIQFKIEKGLYNCFSVGNTTPLDNIANDLSKIDLQNSISGYWLAYISYYKGIYYLKTQANDKVKEELSLGIDKLEKNEDKNTEDYALLALMQSLLIRYSKGMEAADMSMKITENINRSLVLDSLNIRAWYVKGMIDFYTPKQYGGGKNVEEALLKAISLEHQQVAGSYLPGWGKDLSYEMIIRYYLSVNENEKARQMYNEAIQYFPDSSAFRQYEKTFLND